MNLLYRLQQVGGVLMVAWLIGVAIYLLFLTEYMHGVGVTSYTDGTTAHMTYSITFWEARRWWGVVVLAVPVAIAGFGVRAIWQRQVWQIWLAALVMSVISVLWLFSIGLFYAPAALVLWLVALVATMQARINKTPQH